jgi:hypothetical protein
MTTEQLIRVHAHALPDGAVPVRAGGLLAGVRRPCPDHGTDCVCVGRTSVGHLVFWCPCSEHHITAHA